MRNKILLIFAVLIGSLMAESLWTTDFNTCPQTYQSQTCPSPTLVCGYTGGITYCANPSGIIAPSANASSIVDQDAGSINGGYVIDCYSYIGTSPYCRNSGAYWCDRNSTCYTTQLRSTTCLANSFGASTCGACRTGYGNCTGVNCNTQFGITACSAGANNNVPSCGNCNCNTGYVDCDSSGAGAGTGCEIRTNYACAAGAHNYNTGACSGGLGVCACSAGYFNCSTASGYPDCQYAVGGACTVGSLSGTYDGTCAGSSPTCVSTPQHFITGTQANGSSSTPLLWGQQLGGGNVMNLSNSSNQSFIITNTLCMQFPDNTSQCSAAAGGTSWINFNSTACLTGGNISTSGTAGVNASCLISAMGITNGTNGINGTNGVNGTNGLNGTNGINGTGFMVNVSSFSSCPTGGNTYYGYTINTSGGYVWNWSIQICNGLNGVNGTNGTNGINGTNGNNFTYSDWFNQNLNTTSNVTFANIYNKTSTNSSFNFTQICSANQWVISIATGGGTCAQVAFANLSGTVTDAQMTNQKLNVTDQRYNETSLALSLGNWSGNISSYTNTTEIPTLMGNSTISRIGNCTAGQFVQNTTTSGVQCATPTGGAGGGITTVQAANASIIVQNGTVSNFSVNMTFINANIPTYNNGTSNLTIAQVAASIGNWSADKSNYYNISATNSSFNFTKTCSANQWVTSVATGGGTCAQVAFANLSGTVTDAQMANQKLNVTDQRYNETARIDAINTSATILPLYASVQKDPQGFNDKTSDEANQHSTVAFNTITRNFTIQPNGTSYSYYFAGNLITVTTNKSLVIANTSGVHIIYFNSTGDLAETGSISSNILCDNVIVAAINWNTAGYQYIAQDERHTHFMECETHYYLHEHVGTQYDSGLNAIWTTAGGTSSNASAQANVSAGSISDEDYTHNIAGYNSTTGGNFRVYYQIGATGNWSIKNADQFPFIWSDTTTFNGTSGRMAYNLNTAGVWSLTTATSTDYVLIHFFATNSMDNTRDILVVQGQNQYTSAALATTGATTEISNIIGSGLFATEFKPLYSMLLLTNTGYTNAPKAIFMAPSTGGKYIDWRYSSIVGTTGAIGGTVTSVTAGTGITINGVAGATMTATGTVAANPSVVALQNQINNFTSAQNFTTTTYLYNNTNPYNASIYEYWNATCKIIVTSTGRMELC